MRDQVAHALEHAPVRQLREHHHQGHPAARPGRGAGARPGDRLLDRPRAQRDHRRALRRARDGEHQRRGVAEVAVELDRPGALRKLVVELVELERDVVELAAGVDDVLAQLHLDDRQPGQRERLDAEVAGLGRVDAGVLGDLRLHLTRDELIDPLRGDPGPLRGRQRDAHGDVRILALRHVDVAVDAPERHADQQDPRDGPMLGEAPGDVPRVLADDLLVGPVHQRARRGAARIYGSAFTTWPSATTVAPLTMTGSPTRSPSRTTMRLPCTSPRTTSRPRATSWPLRWATTNPASPGAPGPGR